MRATTNLGVAGLESELGAAGLESMTTTWSQEPSRGADLVKGVKCGVKGETTF